VIQSGKVVSAMVHYLDKPSKVLELKIDNRYKDGKMEIVNGVLKGNKNTIAAKSSGRALWGRR